MRDGLVETFGGMDIRVVRVDLSISVFVTSGYTRGL
jgi:hypothetical protein